MGKFVLGTFANSAYVHLTVSNMARIVAAMMFLPALAGYETLPDNRSNDLANHTLYSDDFRNGLSKWVVEAEPGAQISASQGRMEIIAPGGMTVWFRQVLFAPVEISYSVTAIDKGGTYDRVSDLNLFWMARQPGNRNFFDNSAERGGVFANYDGLELYYVGMGGHDNTRTRLRRYIGVPGDRPLVPSHDLTDRRFLIKPNVKYDIRIVSHGNHQRFYRDDVLFFEIYDDEPYIEGRFGLRTVRNHMVIENFKVREFSVLKDRVIRQEAIEDK